MYDLCVIGAGLIGSAAARHASQQNGTKVCLIGPEEPQERSLESTREIFGAHYDEGRITRCSDPDPVWAALAQRSGDYFRFSLYHFIDEGRISGILVTCSFKSYQQPESFENVQDLVTGGTRKFPQKKLQTCGQYLATFPCTPRNRDPEVRGVAFYMETGCLMAGKAQGHFMSQTRDTVSSQSIKHEYLNPEMLKKRFPYLNLSRTDAAIYEQTRSGYINPRAMINAQKRVAMNFQCDVIDDVVCKITKEQMNGTIFMSVLTEGGRKIVSRRVLLATGSFTTFRDLLWTETEPDVTLCPLTVAKVEVNENDVKHLENMPSILYYGQGAPDWPENYPRNSTNLIGIYVLPPIKYPDGKHYIKLGNFADSVSQRLTTLAEVKAWYCGDGKSSLATESARLITAMTKDIKAKSYHGDQCVILETRTGHPYIDLVHSGIGVAIGGNGYAAKSGDEIGRLAAMLVLRGVWDSDIPAETFKLRLKPRKKPQSKI
ncbi:uncharacterized protein LOC132553653 [Ylistrum balloti]|uniref:uncharacterized protein LOC132553653 n=1 Tax=Ylistrum balloti TaxID=509963 RepID=UPI002905BFDA|nr:uncharacterized protein LOC132553653 [Ylistrum balloti]